MAVTSLSTIKSWFVTAAKPLQSQFHAWMDSFYHKEESIPISAITNLQNVLNAKADAAGVTNNIVLIGPGVNTYTVPAGTLISHITFLGLTETNTISISDEHIGIWIDNIDINNAAVIDCKKYFTATTLLTFNGISETTIIRITKG